MATLVKEKRKEKKKSKEKSSSKLNEALTNFNSLKESAEINSVQEISENVPEVADLNNSTLKENVLCSNSHKYNVDLKQEIESNVTSDQEKALLIKDAEKSMENIINPKNNQHHIDPTQIVDNFVSSDSSKDNTYQKLNEELQRIQIPHCSGEYFKQGENEALLKTVQQNNVTNATPSAPVLRSTNAPIETNINQTIQKCENKTRNKTKISCMPLEEVIRIFGGKEIAEIKAMSEREEAAVETGPSIGADHPLVDLLSTFRCSLSALERERVSINCGYVEEEKRRALLWKIEKRTISLIEKCPCGANVDLHVIYDYAELQKNRLPAARLRLEGLLRDVQDSYCHHQHTALLTHCQIEEVISETIQSHKGEIREALSLVLQALRLSDGAPAAFPQALERWATVLADALMDERDLRQLLYIIHHLFRLSRSIQWAGRILRLCVNDTSSAARFIAILDLLLSGCATFDNALECTEELEAWEEIDMKGDGGAVGEGRLRERDLLVILNSLPLRDLVARLVLFTRADVSQSNEYEWGDSSGGHGVLKACCGVRILLDVVKRGARAQHNYVRLRDKLRTLAASVLHSLAALHLHSRNMYTKDLAERISIEMEGCFSVGVSVMDEELDRLPATLLSDETAREYCIAFENLHDNSTKRIESLQIDAPVLSCVARVNTLTQVARDRETDSELATVMLQFLFQAGVKRKAPNLKCSCDVTARESLSRLLDVHPYLHTKAFYLFADTFQGEIKDNGLVKLLYVSKWRPSPSEVQEVLNEWTQRCPQLIQYLLLGMDYLPHSGVSLESQIYIGWWVSQIPDAPEWAWVLLRQLRLHRTHWTLPLEAPGPDKTPETLLEMMFAILATDWGHCVPLVCGPGVEALHRLSASRPIEAVYCLGRLVTVMACSPESISLTPRFSETVTIILNSGPNLIQRALGLGGQSGADLLQNLITQQLQDLQLSVETRSALLTAWLYTLWTPSQVGSSRGILDAAIRVTQGWTTLDSHVSVLLQEENGKQYIDDALRHTATAPLLCESVLRSAHVTELFTGLYPRILDVMARQIQNKQKIHVDNAIKELGATISSEEFVIHRTANALLNVPFSHPAHLTLWRLFFHLYLQRPPGSPHELPVGPLFFSGLVKTRTLAQLKKRLQDAIVYHKNMIDALECSQSIDTPGISSKKVENSPTSDDIFSELSIVDLIEESGDECSGSDKEDKEIDKGVVEEIEKNDNISLISYHKSAEKLVHEYSRWLEEGDKVRAYPYHADVARFIPEQALSVAWYTSIPSSTPLTPTLPPKPVVTKCSPLTYHERAIRAIREVSDRSHRRRSKLCVKSLVGDVNFNDIRSVLNFIEQHLIDVQKFAQEWLCDVQRISQLDEHLWLLVGKLRARKPLPPVKKSCSQNCRPITIRITEDEWCISTAAEREIQENRRLSRSRVRGLCRARPHFARTAAALLTAAKRTSNADTAMSVAERVWRYFPLAHKCSHAQDLLTNVVTLLAEKWICHNSRCSAELLSRWSRGDSSQQLLCSALVAPTKLPICEWAPVYIATCKANLPSHATFSYLSKFDMQRWSREADAVQRLDVLQTLIATAQRWGATPDQQDQVLIELLGVHSNAIVTGTELSTYICSISHQASLGALPSDFCKYLTKAVDTNAPHLTFDQIGHILREVGVIWWAARKSPANRKMYSNQAPHVANLLKSLQRAFVDAALKLSYAPERVTLYAWSSILESWSAWISPQSLPPLLPSACDDEKYTQMLGDFITCLKSVMEDCPGSAETLLCEVWSWAVEMYCAVNSNGTQESHVQMSALLSALAHQLPWSHQWFHSSCLPRAVQISQSTDREITSWCSGILSLMKAETWLRDVPEPHMAPTLAALYELFTSKNMQFTEQCISECCMVPWWRLPTEALDQLLEMFYFQHHNPAIPYHEIPQFNVVLSASQLYVHPSVPQSIVNSISSQEKRCRSVSQYVRAIASPPLHPHLRAHVRHLLRVITKLVPYIQNPQQLEELLTRAIVIMCMEPAGIVLPVFMEWVSSCSSVLRIASISAVATVTAFEYFLPLADRLAKTHLDKGDNMGWQDLQHRWANSAWWEASAFIKRGGLHAAYALLRARQNEHTPARLWDAFKTLINVEINFSENEEIVALWICVASRILVTSEREEMKECLGVARELLDRWSVETKRSLLQVVALQTTAPAPSPRHRLLCRFAQCIVSPSEVTARSYETAVTAVLGSTCGDVITWHKQPILDKLVKLANKLYPHKELYFKEELEMAERNRE